MIAPQDVASASPAGPRISPALLRSRVSLSVGAPNAGSLLRGVRLEPSDQVRIVPAWNHPDFRWGLPQLIDMVERAAERVAARHGPSKISVGDISSQSGGTLRKHKSHQSGRDVDIAFYMIDARGNPVYHDTFVPFDANGRSSKLASARFDDARNWTLIEALLTDPQARVQHVFVSNDLRQRLLREAERRGVSRHLRLRAARVMMQVTPESEHADHFHVRIACPGNQRGACEQHPRRHDEIAEPTSRGRRDSQDARATRGKRRRGGT